MSYKLKEKCGVFGVFDHDNAANLTYFGLHSLQHRGQEGAGISTSNTKKITTKKGLGLLSSVFSDDEFLSSKDKNAIGHVRYSTSGENNKENVQPFVFHHRNRHIAFAHNGNLSNAPELKHELESIGAHFNSTSDTEILGHYLIRDNNDTHQALLNIAPKLIGAFNFVLLEKDAMHIVRDKWGFRPLVLGKKNDKWVVASESCALNSIQATFVRDVERGEIITITKEGLKSSIYDQDHQLNLCAMEYIYFSRPDSNIEGINVHKFRNETGKLLAKEHPIDADIVIPVPDSSLSAASGYAAESGIAYEMGLVKNRYIARTFIEPSQDLRELSVRKKLLPILDIIKDKRVVLVDDSIVRGTTIKEIIKMLWFAGAKEVHVRIASPPIIAPTYYGIDISTYDELIAHGRTLEEVTKLIGATSLQHLSINSLKKVAGNVGLDLCIFNNEYPTYISEELRKEVKNEK